MAYAILETGGKQYRAQEGDEIEVEKIAGKPGDTVKLNKVLLLATSGKTEIGHPYLKGAGVQAKILGNLRTQKVISFKYIRREGNSKRMIGHRQTLTRIKITSLGKG